MQIIFEHYTWHSYKNGFHLLSSIFVRQSQLAPEQHPRNVQGQQWKYNFTAKLHKWRCFVGRFWLRDFYMIFVTAVIALVMGVRAKTIALFFLLIKSWISALVQMLYVYLYMNFIMNFLLGMYKLTLKFLIPWDEM